MSQELWQGGLIDEETAPRAVREYVETLDDAALGAASEMRPKFVSGSDPASQWTAAMKAPAIFACSTTYLIDTDTPSSWMWKPAGRSARQKPAQRAP